MTTMRSIVRLVAMVGGCLSSAIIVLAAIMLVSKGVRARSPGKWETRTIMEAKQRVLVGGKALKNPLPANPANVAEGRENFSHYCYVCHGLDGQNTGVPFSESMSPPVPSLASRAIQKYSDGQLYWVIKNGLWPTGMPASRDILTDDEIWSIVVYVRNLPPAGSLGEPSAYGDSGETSSVKQYSSAGTKRY